jgi:hypothetical protein
MLGMSGGLCRIGSDCMGWRGWLDILGFGFLEKDREEI